MMRSTGPIELMISNGHIFLSDMWSCGFNNGSIKTYVFRKDSTRCLEFVNSSRFNLLLAYETWACLCVGAHECYIYKFF